MCSVCRLQGRQNPVENRALQVASFQRSEGIEYILDLLINLVEYLQECYSDNTD